MDISLFPVEITYNIFIYVKNLYLYKIVNKTFYFIITDMFSYYMKIYSQYLKNWFINRIGIIRMLIKNNNIKALMFFINNYKVDKIYYYITEYASLYNNIEALKLSFTNNYYDYDAILIYASIGGHENLVLLALNNGAIEKDNAAVYAAKNGMLNIIKILYKNKSDIDLSYITLYAASHGHLNVIEWCNENCTININFVAIESARNGSYDVSVWAYKMGAHLFYICKSAIEGNHQKIVEFSYENGIEINEIAYFASKYNRINILKWSLNKGANNINSIIRNAVDTNNVDILNMFNDQVDINSMIVFATRNVKIRAFQWLLSRTQFITREIVNLAYEQNNIILLDILYIYDNNTSNTVAALSAFNGNKNMLSWALKNNANNYEQIRIIAENTNNHDIIDLLEQSSIKNFNI